MLKSVINCFKKLKLVSNAMLKENTLLAPKTMKQAVKQNCAADKFYHCFSGIPVKNYPLLIAITGYT